MSLKQGITAALIVRNNADTLDRCLASMNGYVDRFAIVDTGSTDDTVAIGERHGSEIGHFTWIDDFAAARNASLEMVRTEWTLWMDSDEWFEPEEAIKLVQAAKVADAAGHELLRRNHMPGGVVGTQALIRLWRTSPRLRMRSRIHEHIRPSDWFDTWPGKKIYRSNIRFEHDGFAADDDVKAKRNLPLLEFEVQRDPDNLYMLSEIYFTYFQLGMKDQADATLRTAMRALEKLDPRDRQPGFSAAQIIKVLLRKGADVEKFALGWYGDVPELVLAVAEVAIQRNDLPRAFEIMSGLEDQRLANDWNGYIPVDSRKIEVALATNLALVAHQLERTEVARSQYLRLLALEPGNELALNNLSLL